MFRGSGGKGNGFEKQVGDLRFQVKKDCRETEEEIINILVNLPLRYFLVCTGSQILPSCIFMVQ